MKLILPTIVLLTLCGSSEARCRIRGPRGNSCCQPVVHAATHPFQTAASVIAAPVSGSCGVCK